VVSFADSVENITDNEMMLSIVRISNINKFPFPKNLNNHEQCPDPCGSVSKWLPWIRIQIGNTVSGSGGQLK
jgi:hypothetical protein